MNMKLVWAAWLFVIAASFAGFETYALTHDQMTLSRWVWTVSAAFPPFGWFAGFLTGFLTCHFWWGGIVSFAPTKQEGKQ
jgi:hypothetical protein